MSETVYIGIDLGGTFVRVGAFDQQGEMLAVDQAPIEARRGPRAGLARIISLIETMLAKLASQGKRYELAGIGFGSTGPVYPKTGVIDNPYTLPTWENVSIFEPLHERFGAPLTLENDADVAALGEYWMGAGRGVKRLYAVTVGTGIGAAFILDGRIYRGVNGAHPDGGHQMIDPSGPQCYCGLRGCWESLASGPAIARQARARIGERPDSLLLEMCSGDAAQIDARMVAQAAIQGDSLAASVMEHAAEHFSLGVANIIILFLPDRIATDIDVMVPARQVRIVPAQLGDYAGLYGAAWSVIQKVNGTSL